MACAHGRAGDLHDGAGGLAAMETDPVNWCLRGLSWSICLITTAALIGATPRMPNRLHHYP